MKTRSLLIAAALVASVFAGCSKPSPAIPQSITFAGFTNGYVGPLASVSSILGPRRGPAFMRQWLADGTNCAMFTVTNQQSCDIYILRTARILNAGAHPTNEPTAILNAPNVSIRLKPGEFTNLQIAVLPHQAPWRMRIIYSRTDQRIGLIELWRHWIYQKPISSQSYAADSGLISQ